jgi:four helix bundle protein
MFRFEGFEIRKCSIEITDKIFNLADIIKTKHHNKFADQLRGASLSISNTIAEGSGSSSKRDFCRFLNYTHRSIFETVNMLIIATRRKFIEEGKTIELKNELEEISKMVSGFANSLVNKPLRSKL